MRLRKPGSNLLGAALAYALRGVPVVPCHYPVNQWPGLRPARWNTFVCSCGQLSCLHPAEHPLTPCGLEDASADPNRIAAWWKRYPEANVGVLTGVMFDVLDVADEHRLSGVHREALTGPLTQAGNGRWHHLVQPSGTSDVVALSGASSRPGGVERIHWHGRGGYVLAPPSRHISGTAYRWVRPLTIPLPKVPPPLTAVRTFPALLTEEARPSATVIPLPGPAGRRTRERAAVRTR